MDIPLAKYLPYIKRLFLLLACVFLSYFIFANKHIVYELLTTSNLYLIALSVFAWSCANCVSPLFTKFALSSAGCSISYQKSLVIFLQQLPAKYLPGGIWHTVARYTIYTEHGAGKKQLGRLLIYETLLPVLIAGIAGISIYFKESTIGKIAGLICLAAISLSCLSFAIGIIINNQKLMQNALLILTTFLFWAIASFSFNCYINSFNETLGSLNNTQLTGAYLIGWATGNLAFFSPQGLGVSEAVMSQLIDMQINFGASLSLIFGFRLVIAIADVFSWLMLYTAKKLIKSTY